MGSFGTARQSKTPALNLAPPDPLSVQELNASRLGGAAGDLSIRGQGQPDPAAQHPQQGGLQPPHPDTSSQQRAEDPAGAFSAQLPLSHEPYHPLEFYPTSQFELDWGAPGAGAEPWLGPGATAGDRSRCFVILFGVGRAETEGIYSLRALAKVGAACWWVEGRAPTRNRCCQLCRQLQAGWRGSPAPQCPRCPRATPAVHPAWLLKRSF